KSELRSGGKPGAPGPPKAAVRHSTTRSSVSTRAGSGAVVSATKGPHGATGGAPSGGAAPVSGGAGGPPPRSSNSLAKVRVYETDAVICGKYALRALSCSPRARRTPARAMTSGSLVASARASASSSESSTTCRASARCAGTEISARSSAGVMQVGTALVVVAATVEPERRRACKNAAGRGATRRPPARRGKHGHDVADAGERGGGTAGRPRRRRGASTATAHGERGATGRARRRRGRPRLVGTAPSPRGDRVRRLSGNSAAG